MKRIVSFILLTFIAGEVLANPLDNLVKFAKDGGAMVNVNKAAVSDDQRAGYLMGGSIISRGPAPQDLQPMTVQVPRFELDPCSKSFDMRFGGLSYVKGKEILRYFKNTLSASGLYAYKLLMKNQSSVIENIMSELEAMARDINSHSYNQCQTAQNIAKSGLSMLNISTQQGCLQKSNVTNSNSDLFQSQQKCQADPYKYDDASDDEKLKSQLGSEFNLVWKALSMGNGSNDDSLKNLMMSISGTVIQRKGNDGSLQLLSMPSLVEGQDLIEHYMGQSTSPESKVKLYVCDETKKCLYPTVKDETLKSNENLIGNVERILKGLQEKVYNNEEKELNDEEQALVSYSTIPIISQIELDFATRQDSGTFIVGTPEFVDVVSYDLIVSFLQKMLNNASNAVEQMESVSVDAAAFERFSKNVQIVRSYLNNKKAEAHRKLAMIMQLKERLQQQEEVFETEFSRHLDVLGE